MPRLASSAANDAFGSKPNVPPQTLLRHTPSPVNVPASRWTVKWTGPFVGIR
jgi:hypothetical protein